MSWKKFPVIGGSLIGTAVAALYLWRNYSPLSAGDLPSQPDPAWTVLINIILIFFVAIFTTVRLCRLVMKLFSIITRQSGT